MSQCIDTQLGDLLYAYELGMLSEDEKRAFEQHLVACEFCSHRAEKNLEAARIIRDDPEIHDYTVSLGEEKVSAGVAEAKLGTADRRTWRRWSYSLSAAAALVLLLVLIDWQIDIRPVDEVVAASNRLAILNFENVADPTDRDHLGEIATNLLITGLGESKYLRVISGGYILDLAGDGAHRQRVGERGGAARSLRVSPERGLRVARRAPCDRATHRHHDAARLPDSNWRVRQDPLLRPASRDGPLGHQ